MFDEFMIYSIKHLKETQVKIVCLAKKPRKTLSGALGIIHPI